MTINTSDVVALGPKKLGEVLDALKRRGKLVADRAGAELQLNRIGQAIEQIDQRIARIVGDGSVTASSEEQLEVPRKLRGRLYPKGSSPDLAGSMEAVLRRAGKACAADEIAERLVGWGYPANAEKLADRIKVVARSGKERFFVRDDGWIRLARDAVKPPVALDPKKPGKKSGRSQRRKPDLAAAMQKALANHPKGLPSDKLAEAVVAVGYRGKAAMLRGVVGRIARVKKDRFIVARSGLIRIAGGALEIPEGRTAKATSPAHESTSVRDRILSIMKKAEGDVPARHIIKGVFAGGFKSESKTPDQVVQQAITKMAGSQLRRVRRGVYRLAELPIAKA
jgi:hypothetical protein